MKPFARLVATVDVMNNEAGTFTDTQTGLLKEQDQKIVAPPKWGFDIDGTEEPADLARG